MNKIYHGKNKWFDGDCLPHYQGKENVMDWRNSVGCTVEFQCKNYHGFYTIVNKYPDPNKQDEFLYDIYFDNDKEKMFVVDRKIMRTVNFEYRLGIHSLDFLYNIGDIINNKYLVLNRERKLFYKNDKHAVRSYTLKCLKDDYIFEIPEYMIKKQQKLCPLCYSTVLVVGVNDIATQNPELIKFLANKDDAYKYRANTSELLNFKCDICGEKFESSPPNFSMSLPCGCYSTQSYPNRFIAELFRTLDIPFITELRKCHFDWCESYRYDLYFEYNDKKYIVEMDGGFHKRDKEKKTDAIKDNLAKQHYIEVIRIDCDYKNANKRFSYIRDNVINSKLSTILNLSDIDWNSINVKILTTNNAKEIWRLKKLGYTHKQVANIFNISISEVTRHVYNGCEIGELKPFSMNDTNVYSKVMIVTNLETKEKKYYVGLKDFYNNSKDYIGFKMSDIIFKKNEKDGHSIIGKYDMYKITYSEYIKETVTI